MLLDRSRVYQMARDTLVTFDKPVYSYTVVKDKPVGTLPTYLVDHRVHDFTFQAKNDHLRLPNCDREADGESKCRVITFFKHIGNVATILTNVIHDLLFVNIKFFAEDVFGGQFCIKSNKICSFDPETGALQDVAEDMEGWARSILADYDFMTGYSLCHEWQRVNGRLNSGLRLVPKVPFVAGGKFNVQNLHVIEAVKGMRLRGQIALQIKDIPDGEQIKLKIVE